MTYAILNTARPAAGNMRALTSSEAAALRAMGVSCSTAWQVSYIDGRVARLYRPIRGSRNSLENTGVMAHVPYSRVPAL